MARKRDYLELEDWKIQNILGLIRLRESKDSKLIFKGQRIKIGRQALEQVFLKAKSARDIFLNYLPL